MELVEEKNMVKTHCQQLEKIKIEYDKLTEELTQNEEENIKLRRKCEFVKQELEKKVNLPAFNHDSSVSLLKITQNK